MSCNTCQTKFSFFTKENGCPKCGFSYCSKCLKYKCDVPDFGIKKVCGKCYNKSKLSNNPNQQVVFNTLNDRMDESLAPIDITSKLDSLENPAKPPIVVYSNHWDNFKKGLEPVDHEIVDRLRKLKEENIVPSEDDIRKRLDVLKGQETSAAAMINIHATDTRSDQEKTDDLIKEYLEKLKLGDDPDFCKDIELRLRALQEKNTTSCPVDELDDDEKTITKRLIEKALAEAAMEKKYGDEDESEEMEIEQAAAHHSEDDTDVSCVMCDETTNLVRCTGCYGDLYCSSCFEVNHDDFEMEKHQKKPIHIKKSSS